MVKLKTEIDFQGSKDDGSPLNWHVEPYRLEESDDVYVHVIDDKTGKIVFEILLSDWQKISEAVAIANKAEVEGEKLNAKEA